MTSRPVLCFVAESTLGKLAKWLRLAGFDTLYDSRVPDARLLAAHASADQPRIVLTRTRAVRCRLPAQQVVMIRHNDPLDQARQVMQQLGLRRQDLRPLTRCALCNHRLCPLDKQVLQARVPDYVWQRHERFRGCPQCGRVYWAGSHAAKWLALMDRWFEARS